MCQKHITYYLVYINHILSVHPYIFLTGYIPIFFVTIVTTHIYFFLGFRWVYEARILLIQFTYSSTKSGIHFFPKI